MTLDNLSKIVYNRPSWETESLVSAAQAAQFVDGEAGAWKYAV
jgi:hypothetical protein